MAPTSLESFLWPTRPCVTCPRHLPVFCPHLLCSGHLASFLLHNMLGTVQPQRLCTCHPLYLERFSPRCVHGWFPHFHWPLLRCPFLRKVFPDCSKMATPPLLMSPPSLFFFDVLGDRTHPCPLLGIPQHTDEYRSPGGRHLVLFTAVPRRGKKGGRNE